MEGMFDECWPLPRSLTGDGVRRTHDIIARHIPLRRHEVPSGTAVFDWIIPDEWSVGEAYVLTPDGRRILDFKENNLHLVNYSVPFRGTVSLAELQAHLYSRPSAPEAVPYITSYYKERWGFCVSDRERRDLVAGDYEVVVDTEIRPGSLTISDASIEGESKGEVLITTYTCHPSMANDQLSGIIAATMLWKRIAAWPRHRLSYRFVFLPETIGSIAYLSMQGRHLVENMIAGYVVALVGGRGPFTYRRSRRGNSLADRAVECFLASCGEAYDMVNFDPSRGNDQRQFCSPGFDLPMGCLTHTPMQKSEEYHSSLDDKERLSFAAMEKCIDAYENILSSIENNGLYLNTKPDGEPHLGKYGLYDDIGDSGSKQPPALQNAIMWVLNMSDGRHDLMAIAEKSGYPFSLVAEASRRLLAADLLTIPGAAD
jgi:aminopeptidase-like protein